MTKYTSYPEFAQIQYGATKFSSQPIEKTVAFTGAAGNGAAGTVALYTVTGTVLMKMIGVCVVDLVSAGGATFTVGTAGAAAGICASQTATDLDAGEMLGSAAIVAEVAVSTSFTEYIISNGQDIIITISTEDITAGTIKFLLSYVPLSDGASVVAA